MANHRLHGLVCPRRQSVVVWAADRVDTSWDTPSQCMLAALLAFVLAAVALVGRFEALWTLPIAAGTLGCLWALWTYPEWGNSTQVLFVLVMSGVAVGGLGGGLQRPNLLPHTTTLVPIVRQAIRSLDCIFRVVLRCLERRTGIEEHWQSYSNSPADGPSCGRYEPLHLNRNLVSLRACCSITWIGDRD